MQATNQVHPLITEIKEALAFFRDVFSSQPQITRSISPAYEDSIVKTMTFLINTYSTRMWVFDNILKYFRLIRIIGANIDWEHMSKDIEVYDKQVRLPHLKINTQEIVRYSLESIDASKVFDLPQSVFDKIVDILGPIFKCVDILFHDPCTTLGRIGELCCTDEIM